MKPYPSKVGSYFFLYLKRYKKIIIPLLFLIVVSTFFEKMIPYYFSKIIDVVSENLSDKLNLISKINYYLLAFIAVLILFNLLRRFGMYLAQQVIVDIGISAKKEALDYVLGHSVKFLTDIPTGTLGAKVNNLSEEMPRMLMQILWDFYRSGTLLVVTLGMLIATNLLFGVVFLLWIMVFGFVLYKMSNRLRFYSIQTSERRNETSGRFLDILSNALLVKSFSSINFENKSLKNVLDAEKKADYLMISKLENSRFIQFIIIALFQISMLVLSLFLWYVGAITAGAIVFVLLLISDIMQVFQFFMFALLEWNKRIGSLESSLMLLSKPHEIEDCVGAHKIKPIKGNIEFSDICFGYSSKKKVFQGFNLKVKAGEKVGLVGISGSGKTTLVNLLQRFYDVDAGQILIDNQDISKVTQSSLRSSIAVIPQDTSLFHRSVFENIAYGKLNVSKKEVYDAAKKAFADEFIKNLPSTYDTMVGERGVKLSGGQRQRIAIARAILKDAPILILDEATSALDSASEAFIQKSMHSLMKGKTVIAIAHRLSTLKEMDRIVVLSKGKIIEQGTANELLAKNGAYARLWKIQTGK